MPAQRKRKQFKFWLDLLKPQEKYLADVVAWLTEQGEFVRSIRDGLRLIYDLRFQKDTCSLLEMFPDIRERLQVSTAAPIAGGGGGQSELAKEIAAQIILQGGTPGYLMQSHPLHSDDLITPADIAYLERQKKAPMKAAAAPPKAEAQQVAVTVSADDIADNFLSMFD
ncbi:MAG: hypothetical protein H0X30_05600 [Anaerolineae bacterium]|nr:hypothetical protein [Anaerolineae bacterium]